MQSRPTMATRTKQRKTEPTIMTRDIPEEKERAQEVESHSCTKEDKRNVKENGRKRILH